MGCILKLTEAKAALLAATQRLTPENRLNAFWSIVD
jgi:hypothetical protein